MLALTSFPCKQSDGIAFALFKNQEEVMVERKDEDKKKVNNQDGSEKKRPEDQKDFAGIERAQNAPYSRPTEETNEWESREAEGPTP